MPTLNFPINPTVGQTYDFGQYRYRWDGQKWSTIGNGFNQGAILTTQMREALRRSYAEAGYNLVEGSFETGGIFTNENDVLLHEKTGKAYSGPAGPVAAGTNPTSGGGFVDRSGSSYSEFIGERSLLEFIPRAYWSGVLDGSNTVDMTPYVQAAVDSGESIKQLRKLILRLDSPIFLYGGVPYDLGGSIFKPTDAFGVVQHKIFTENEGKYVSGQHFGLKNLRIEGDPTKKYNSAGAGLKFNKDTTGVGYAVYDATIENVVVKDMYHCFNDKEQSGAWMTTFKHLKGINCPVGFSKSIGTTIVLQNVYMQGGHRGFELDNLYGMDMLGCAHDGGSDYAPDFLDSRILITNSEINMQTMRAEYLSANRRFLNIGNSKVNIGVLSLANYTANADSTPVDFIAIGTNSVVNIDAIKLGNGTVTGSNTVTTVAATGGAVVTTEKEVPYAAGSSSLAISAFNARVYGSKVPDSKINAPSGYVEQTQTVTLYVNQSTGSDTASGLTSSNAKQSLSSVIAEINAKYRNHVVTVQVSGEVSLVGSNRVDCKKLTLKRNGSGSLVVVVSAGVAGRIYGPSEIVVDMNTLTFSGTPGSFTNGIPFPSAVQDLDYSLDSIQLKIDSITLPANSALTGAVLFGYNGMMSVGVRDSAISGAGVSSSYICHLSSGTAQITRGGGSITGASLTNGTQISASNMYFA